MKLTLNQDVFTHRNELMAKKGEKLTLISDHHLPVLLVISERNVSFAVRVSGTNYEEVKKTHH